MQIVEKIKVIIADDYPKYIEALKILLSSSDKYQIIETCGNGFELITSDHLSSADIVLIDINMPVMDGIDAAKRIDFEYLNTPLIAITMHESEIFLKDIIAAGFKGFVYKPRATEELLKVMDEVLNKKFAFPKNLKIHKKLGGNYE